ncbi:uncharacterized protein G2W53_033447 [Senna tora]|uniref:Uncharacterized protein n=1 Tax=Senna tora TaxID=362788 RepID=A0A834SZA1_9FABA|nr:uncharacterized protein G2W53_033447 [Senna tora]
MGLVIVEEVCEVMPRHVLISKGFKQYKPKRVIAQVNQTDHFALYFGIQVD